MNRLAALLLLLLTAGAAAATMFDLGKVAGQYRYSFPNGDTSGAEFTSTNDLKIVRLSATRAYVEAYLEFYNGHTCDFEKVMTVEGRDLVYRAPNDEGDPCEMRLHFTGGKISFEDREYRCRVDTCGTRGGYNGIEFPMASRHPVSAKDMVKLRASDAYRDALQGSKP